MMRRFLRLTVPVLVAAVAAVAMTPAAATAAGTPGWRIVQVLPNMTVDGITALGAADAWLSGDSCGNAQCSTDTLIVRHWDGKAWRAVTPPKAFIDSPVGQGAGPVVATSASNAWVFAYRGKDEVDYTDALHWTGKGWAAPVELDMNIASAVAPSASDVWAFGAPESSTAFAYVAHYDGTTWTQAPFPIMVTFASALSPSDIWVAGAANSQLGPSSFAIEHWNGHVWQKTPLPDLGIAAGTPAAIAGITAVAARDAWAEVAVLYPPCSARPDGGAAKPSCTAPADDGVANSASDSSVNTYLLHWNGTAWTRVAFPYPGMAVTPAVSDGDGGIWLTVDVISGSSSTLWFCHFSDGRWTRTAVPKERGKQPSVVYLSWIPGTRSLWAAGTDTADNGSSILKDGP